MNCPNCSNPIIQGATFCGNCGHAMTQNAAQTPGAAVVQPTFPAPDTVAPVATPVAIPVQDGSTAQTTAQGIPVAPAVVAPAASVSPTVTPSTQQPQAQPYGTPLPTYPTSPASNALNSNQDYGIKLFTLKHLLIIILVSVAYAALQNIVPALVGAMWIASIVYTFITVTKIKQNPAIGTTEIEKRKAVALMTLDPLITQAIYYYRLRSINPPLANGFNMLGWKVLGFAIACYVVAIIILSMILFNKQAETTPSNNSTPQPVATAKATAYPAQTKAGFTKGCTDESGNAEVCTCLFNEIEKNITHDEFVQAEDQISKTGNPPAKYQAAQDAALKACGF